MKKLLLGFALAAACLLGQSPFNPVTASRVIRGTGAPSSTLCSAAADRGKVYIRSDAAAANSSFYACVNTTGSTTAWELQAGGSGATSLTGDTTGTASGSAIATTTVKVNGTSVPVNSAADQFLGTTASATGAWASVPNCGDSSHGLAYNTTTHVFSCQSITGAAGSPSFPINPQTSTYQVLAADFTACKVISVASGTFTATLVASGSQPTSGQCIWIVNYGSGVVTVARSGQNINGGTASLTLPAGSATVPSAVFVVSDGVNYFASLHEVPAIGACTNQVVTGVNGTAVPTCSTVTSTKVDNSIALTGTDINTSNQVTSAHLAAGLPRAQGGLNSTSAGTGILRDGTTPAASELSGDCTTSGSNAVTCPGFPAAITTSTVYFICTKANASTCGSTDTSNLWNGNAVASPTISDSNNCTAVATPCATLQGVETKIHGKQLGTGVIVTIYIADEANTGTDCLVPNTVTFSNRGVGLSPFSASEQALAGVFPPSYVYIYGNPTTPANVVVAGSNGCNSTVVGTVFNGVTADGGTALRVNGIKSEGFGKTATSFSAVFAAEGGSILYAENFTCIQTASSHNSCAGAFNTGSTLRMGGTWSVTGAATHAAAICAFSAACYTWDPLATSSANTTLSISSGSSILSAQQHSIFHIDRFTWTNTGNNATIFSAFWHSAVMYTEAYLAANCPTKCFIGTNNASGVTYQQSVSVSYVDADCSTSNDTGCTMTQQPTFHSTVQTGGIARVYNTGGTNTQVITAPDNILVGGCVSYFPGDGTSERSQCNEDSQLSTCFSAPKAAAASGQAQIWCDSGNGSLLRAQNASGTSQYLAEVTNTSTTTTQVPHATATAGVYTTSAIVSADLPSTVVRTDQANTAGTAMTLDMSAATGATALKVPVIAGATAGADGVVDYDSTAKITHVRTNGADSLVAATTGTSTTTTQVLHATATAGVYTPSAIAGGDLPATAVQTGQSNTWTTGSQDMGSATSHKIPTSAGAGAAASGVIAMDSTRGSLKAFDDLVGAATTVTRLASAQLGSSDTLTCSTIGAATPTLFATTWSVPANLLIANKVLRLMATFNTVTTGINYTLKVKLGSTYIYSTGAGVATQTLRTSGGTWMIQGTAAAGASVNVETGLIGAGGYFPVGSVDTLTQPIAVATNSTNTLAFELTCSANTAGNSLTLRQMVVEVLN